MTAQQTTRTNLTLPVSNSDITPCLTCHAWDSFPSSAEISPSEVEKAEAWELPENGADPRRLLRALFGCNYLPKPSTDSCINN
jgi:hypothetical protein